MNSARATTRPTRQPATDVEPRFVVRWITPLTAVLALCALLAQPEDGNDAIVVAVGMVSGWLL